MKKTLFVFVAVAAICISLSACQKTDIEAQNCNSEFENSPIDSFYENLEPGNSTMEMNIIANSWGYAWECETRSAAEWLKEQLPLQADRELVDAYIAGAEQQIRLMEIMAIYPVTDLELPQDEREMSSGTLKNVMRAEMHQQLWRDTFNQLLKVAPGTGGTDAYNFKFNAASAQLELDAALSES